jgi:RNase P/RNase MRP subunit p29
MQTKAKPERFVLIGKTIRITNARNKTTEGTEGKVIDETKNTITIMTTKGRKTIIKDQATIGIGDKKISGKNLAGRIEARIKQ